MPVSVIPNKGINRVEQHVGRAVTHAVKGQHHHRGSACRSLVVRQHPGAVVGDHTDVVIGSRGGVDVGVLNAGLGPALNRVGHNQSRPSHVFTAAKGRAGPGFDRDIRLSG